MHAAMGWRPRGQTVPPIRAREHLSSSTACAYTDSYACGSRILRYYAYECISRGTWHTWGTVACKSAVSLDALVRMPLVQQEVLVALREIVLLRRVRQVLSTEPTQRLRGREEEGLLCPWREQEARALSRSFVLASTTDGATASNTPVQQLRIRRCNHFKYSPPSRPCPRSPSPL